MKLSKKQTLLIKGKRKELKLSQEKVAYELNIQQNIYSKIENGTQDINSTKLKILEKFLKIQLTN